MAKNSTNSTGKKSMKSSSNMLKPGTEIYQQSKPPMWPNPNAATLRLKRCGEALRSGNPNKKTKTPAVGWLNREGFFGIGTSL